MKKTRVFLSFFLCAVLLAGAVCPAFAADTGERTEEEIPYAAGYTPEKIVLKNTAALTLPKDGVFALDM